jgi:hypothetical protein
MQERTAKIDLSKRATGALYRMVVLRPDGAREVMGDGLSFQEAWSLQTELAARYGFANVFREPSGLTEPPAP